VLSIVSDKAGVAYHMPYRSINQFEKINQAYVQLVSGYILDIN
jgi:hypothetical protein